MLNSKAGKGKTSGDVDTQIRGEEMHISIGGDFNIGLAPEVRDAIRQGLDAGLPRITIDMRNVDYIDSSGIGTLVLGVPEQAKKLLKFPPFCEDGEFKTGVFGE